MQTDLNQIHESFSTSSPFIWGRLFGPLSLIIEQVAYAFGGIG